MTVNSVTRDAREQYDNRLISMVQIVYHTFWVEWRHCPIVLCEQSICSFTSGHCKSWTMRSTASGNTWSWIVLNQLHHTICWMLCRCSYGSPDYGWTNHQSFHCWSNSNNKSVRILLSLTRLAHMKWFLVIICHNSHEKLTKSEIRFKLELVRTLLRITRLAHRKSYLVIICPNSHEKLTNGEIRSNWSWSEHCSESLI